jgi:hypothetical protein
MPNDIVELIAMKSNSKWSTCLIFIVREQKMLSIPACIWMLIE